MASGSSGIGSPRGFMATHGTARIEGFEYGHGDEAVIIAAGLARPASQLERLASDVAASGIRAVTFNYRGIGASDGPLDGFTLHDLADDVWAIADHLGIDRVHLAGKTFGNRVMRTAASDRPERTATITLIGAGGEIPPSDETVALYSRLMAPDISPEEWSELNTLLNYAPGNEHVGAHAIAHGRFPAVAEAQIAASEATPSEEWVTAGTVPMLVMAGLQDRVAIPANALALASRRPNTWLLGIPACGHNMVDEQPEALSEALINFMTGAALV